LGELVDYVRKKGMTPSIATNGYYLHDLLRSGKLKNVEWIMVSIDWPDAERHDKYRGIKVFDRAVEGIKTAIEMKKQAFISTVVTKENIHCMEEMLTFAQNLGVMVEMLPCEDIIREQEHCAHVVEDIESYIPDLNFYASEIRRLEKKYHNLFTDSVTANIIESGGFGNQNYLHCVSARSYLFIKADGFLVFPCKIHPLLKIDVRKYDLKQAYHSYEAKKIMDMQDRFPFCKGCRFGCAIATSIPTRMAPLYQKYMKAFFRGNMF
jgi:MoaA/NifB/PqqE/SkfB family radical SAM enzyme